VKPKPVYFNLCFFSIVIIDKVILRCFLMFVFIFFLKRISFVNSFNNIIVNYCISSVISSYASALSSSGTAHEDATPYEDAVAASGNRLNINARHKKIVLKRFYIINTSKHLNITYTSDFIILIKILHFCKIHKL